MCFEVRRPPHACVPVVAFRDFGPPLPPPRPHHRKTAGPQNRPIFGPPLDADVLNLSPLT